MFLEIKTKYLTQTNFGGHIIHSHFIFELTALHKGAANRAGS